MPYTVGVPSPRRARGEFILDSLNKIRDSFDGFHHLADIGQASTALGVAVGTVAGFGLLFRHDPFHDERAAVLGEIVFNILLGIAKAVANQVEHQMLTSYGVAGVHASLNSTTLGSLQV